MNLDTFEPKNETKDLLLSIIKNSEKLIEQTHTKPHETLEFKLIQLREADSASHAGSAYTFSFTQSNNFGVDSKGWLD